uniref:Uncharacterized protein n=1 Tax=Apteryx owenii TaxID=8824 RepID=A0A8B9Q1N4_APTOW
LPAWVACPSQRPSIGDGQAWSGEHLWWSLGSAAGDTARWRLLPGARDPKYAVGLLQGTHPSATGAGRIAPSPRGACTPAGVEPGPRCTMTGACVRTRVSP